MTTYLDADHGALLKCNNETILCNSEEWLVDGSVAQRNLAYTTTAYTSMKYPSFGAVTIQGIEVRFAHDVVTWQGVLEDYDAISYS